MPELVPRRRDPLVIGLLSLLVVLVGVGVYLLAVKPELERRVQERAEQERQEKIAKLKKEVEQLQQQVWDAVAKNLAARSQVTIEKRAEAIRNGKGYDKTSDELQYESVVARDPEELAKLNRKQEDQILKQSRMTIQEAQKHVIETESKQLALEEKLKQAKLQLKKLSSD